MNRQQHEEELLGPYVLGVLDPDEVRRVEAHVGECVHCQREVDALREMENALGEVPEEAFWEGPPPGGDLLLQRTLRQVRTEQATVRRRRWAVAGLAAAASLAAVFWAGTQAADGPGRAEALPPAPSTAPATPAPSPPPPGTRVASATDQATGVRMTVQMTPATKWVRVHAAVTGVPAGERCRIVVVGRDGSRTTAGGWVVGAQDNGEAKGASLDGSAAVDPANVKAIVVENEAGRTFVSVPV
ncbi:anti-sigma factor [Streptomyces sp. WAC06614]|uniref:anti-sigma factor family protein n=1 Tax=Streptomyces sp. WAC06614 TaxID=2487416 RepID=UPI000F78C6B1|nr:zf-HC2 domain-containing protein [Streptomyces sp. WAC06614]RSS82278.1 anti-sigma factor [Streptomyces sp. WAC06614]